MPLITYNMDAVEDSVIVCCGQPAQTVVHTMTTSGITVTGEVHRLSSARVLLRECMVCNMILRRGCMLCRTFSANTTTRLNDQVVCVPCYDLNVNPTETTTS